MLAQLPMLGLGTAGQVVVSGPGSATEQVSPPIQSAEPVPMLDIVQGQAQNVEMSAPEAGLQVPQTSAQVPQTNVQVPQTEAQVEVSVPHFEQEPTPAALAPAPTTEIAQASASIVEPAPESIAEQIQALVPTLDQTAPIAQAPIPVPTNDVSPAQGNPIPAEVPQDQIIFENLAPAPVPEAQATQVPSVPIELANIGEASLSRAGSNELPAIQEMDMYARNATPDEPENPQLVLTEEDLALASSDMALASAELDALGGAEMSLVGAELEMPGNIDLPDMSGLVAEGQSVEPQQGAQGLGAPPQAAEGFNSSLGISSGEGTPNAGIEPDMFAFWDAR